MDLDSSLEAFGIHWLERLSLSQLLNKLLRTPKCAPPRRATQVILMAWLQEQLKEDRIDDPSILPQFVQALKLHHPTDLEPLKVEEVDEFFSAWYKEEEPVFRRRFLTAQSDIHLLIDKSVEELDTLAPVESTSLAKAGNGAGIAARESDDMQDPVSKPLGRGPLHTSANSLPLGVRPPSSPGVSSMADVSTEYDRAEAKAHGQQAQVSHHMTSEVPDPTGHSSLPHTSTHKGEATAKQKKTDLSSKPPGTYKCKRCGKTGHWIQKCPTNSDPKWDQKPGADYRCYLCHRYGHHFATLCPRNTDPDSLTVQRKQARRKSRGRVRSPATVQHKRKRDVSPPAISKKPRGRSSSPSPDSWNTSERELFPPSETTRDGRKDRTGDAHRRVSRSGSQEEEPDHDGARPHCDSSLSGDGQPQSRKNDRQHGRERGHHSYPIRSIQAELGLVSRHGSKHRNAEVDGQPRYHAGDRHKNDSSDERLALASPKDRDQIFEKNIPRHQNTSNLTNLCSTTISDGVLSESAGSLSKSVDEILETLRLECLLADLGLPSTDESSDENIEVAQYSDPTLAEGPDGVWCRVVNEAHFRPEVVSLFSNRPNPIIHAKEGRPKATEI